MHVPRSALVVGAAALVLAGAATAQSTPPRPAGGEATPAQTTPAQPAPAAAGLPVRRVILSSSGLAHFEHAGPVSGDARVALPVRLDQVDDLLKSLIVRDSTGSVLGVSLPGRQPLEQIFRDLPFSQADLGSPVALLNALKGAEVEVEGGTTAEGRLLSVVAETATDKDGATYTQHRITLLTQDGITHVLLEDLEAVRFVDPSIQEQIGRALGALLEHRAQDRRTLEVQFRGQGTREVGLGYVITAPLWKAAYRLVLPAPDGASGGEGAAGGGATGRLFQGWAILENLTGTDWSAVDLTLVSGNPVTYRQSLYTAYYASRPELPVEVFGRVMPRTDTGAVATVDQMLTAMLESEIDGGGRAEAQNAEEKADRVRQIQMQRRDQRGPGAFAAAPSAADMMPAAPPPPPPPAQAAMAAQSEEATSQVLFRFPQPVTLATGRSLTLPFVDRALPAERVWVYQPETHATHPLASVRLTNDGESGLPPGILTLFEEGEGGIAFVGDAQLPVLAQGDSRLISFALDNKTRIDRTDDSDRSLVDVAISEGVLRLTWRQEAATSFTIRAPEGEGRLVILEHPRRTGWELVQPSPAEVEATATHYRLRVPVAPGAIATRRIVLEQPQGQAIGLADMDPDTFLAYARTTGTLKPQVRTALEQLAEKRRRLAQLERTAERQEERRQRLFEEQERIRQNLGRVQYGDDLGRRYRERLSEQEDQLMALENEREALEAQREAARQDLANAIAALKI